MTKRKPKARAALWTMTPETLQQLGLGVPAVMEDAPATVAGRREMLERFPLRLEVGADFEPLAPSGAGEPAALLPEVAQSAGDALVLIVTEIENLDGTAVWVRVIAWLLEKNFVRSWTTLEQGDLGRALKRAVAGTGFGIRVQISAGALDGLLAAKTGRAALLTCRWSAHLALVNFVERRFGLRAEVVGRVVAVRR